MAEGRPNKIAVIGATGYEHASPEARVECFAWNRLRKASNLADFDTVVINLLSFQDKERLDGGALRKALNVRTAQEVLRKRGGAFYVLGDPRFSVTWRSAEGEHSAPFLYWTGIDFAWDERSGDTIERDWRANRGPFKPFADSLSRWNYSLAAARPEPEGFAEVWNVDYLQGKGHQPAVQIDAICDNSYGNHLLFSVSHAEEQIVYQYGVQILGTKDALSGPVYFLPESGLSEEEALEFVLRELCGADVSAPEPEWVAEYVAPGQEEVDREIDELEARIEGLIRDHDGKIEERAEVRNPLKLLYETGAALEEAVRFVLEALGAEVEPPGEDRTNEDGWVTVRVGDETFDGVLEVKGVKTKHFNLEGLRQLTDWIERGRTHRRKTYTGLFVGNSSREDPPRRRIWPFNKNWVEQAEMRGYAAIRTEDLYALYLLDRTGMLNREEFWRELFSTKGPFDMRPHRKKLTAEEHGQLENIPEV